METLAPALGKSLLDVFPSEGDGPALPIASAAAVEDIAARPRKTKRPATAARQLDGWERYRALNDAMDEAYEIIDIANREARFALLVMGVLNAFVLIAASRADIVGAFAGNERMAAGGLLVVYAVTAVYFLYQAIGVLHPGRFRPKMGEWTPVNGDFPKGVRYYEDVVDRDVWSHYRAWCDVELGQLNAELAVQFHGLCFKSQVKRVAVSRLFVGLRVMTLLVASLMVLVLYVVWS